MLALIDSDICIIHVCIYYVIPRVTTKKSIQGDKVKNTIDKMEFLCFRKQELKIEEQRNKQKTISKMADSFLIYQ